MKSSADSTQTELFPLTRDLGSAYTLSLIAVLLLAAVSLAGLITPSAIYRTPELRETYLTNDLINLVLGLPILFGSMWLGRRGKLVGLLCWPGALLYILYNYLAYLFGMPLSWLTSVYLVLVLLSTYSFFDILRSIDHTSMQRRISGVVPVKTSGWFLIVFGVLFIFRAIGMISQAGNLPSYEIGTLIADVVISVLWVACGILLLQRKPFGYVSGLGLLFVASELFIALILFLFLQPVLVSSPIAWTDVVVVSIMGVVCSVPTWLFARGVISIQNPS